MNEIPKRPNLANKPVDISVEELLESEGFLAKVITPRD